MPDILIFDDDPHIGDLASELLRSRGLTVAHFSSGAGALQMVQTQRPKLVVLDIMMPGMDGFSACRAIRSNPMTRPVKIIVMSAKTSKEDEELARQYGADMFLHKPFDSRSFAMAVGIVLKMPMAPKAPAARTGPPLTVTLLESGAIIQSQPLWVCFDAGPGFKAWMKSQKQTPLNVWILLTRFKKEFYSEIGAGERFLANASRVNLGGPDDLDATLSQIGPLVGSAGGRTPYLFPLREGEFQLAKGCPATLLYTHNPGLTVGYRVEIEGRRIVYCPANNIDGKIMEWNGYEMNKFRALFSNADLLVHGYRRSMNDPLRGDDRGLCAWEPALDLAAECHVSQVAFVPMAEAIEPPSFQARIDERIRGARFSLRGSAGRPLQQFLIV